MYVKKKKNASGSTSVLVVSKDNHRRHRLVKNMGCGNTPSEISVLVSSAKEYIANTKGPFLPGLLEEESEIEGFLCNLGNNSIQVIGPELVFGSLYDRIGYGNIASDIFRHLVICRLYNPGSKLKTVEYLEQYLHVTYSVDAIYRFLDNLCVPRGKKPGVKEEAQGIQTEVESISYAYTKSVMGGEVAVCFYDMTTLYFEAAEEDELRRYGFSKDGKNACPQIFLGLLVAAGGNPIGYDIFEGNTSESKTLLPMIRKLAGKFGFDKPVVVADSGLLTKGNMADLEREGYQYILGARPKNEKAEIKDKILSFNLKDGETREIDKGNGVRLVVSRSAQRARKDEHNRQRGLDRLKKNMQSGKLTKQHINNRGYNKYLSLKGDVSISIDMDKFEADAQWDGIKGYLTNTDIPASEVIANYANLWYIERAFRFNKSDLAVRPIYHRLRNRIEAHICICFTAYSILLELERRLKACKSPLSVKKAQELTKGMYALTYRLPKSGVEKRIVLKMTPEQQMLYDVIHPPK